MISTPTRGVSRGKRVMILFAGLAVAAAGALAFAGGQAKASGFEMSFGKGEVNLGFAFQGADILPAPPAIPGAVSNPNFNPAQPVSSTNSTTVQSPSGTPLFDYNRLNPADFSTPGVNGGTFASFRPLGCGTPVTFGAYAAMAVKPNGAPGSFPNDIILNPVNQSATQPGFVINPIANAGPATGAAPYYRVLNQGAIVAAGSSATFVNPFTSQQQTITGPYPAQDTLWQPFALSAAGVPTGISGAPGLNTTPNALWCPNPANANVSGVNTDGQIEIQSNDFDFPIMIVPNPLTGGPVPITIESDGPVSGEFDPATGGLNIAGDVEVRVLTGLATNPLGSYCSVPLPGRIPGGFGQGTARPDGKFGLTTSYMLPKAQGFAGTPFTNGLNGPGALTGTFNVTADSTPVGGADCSTVNSVSKGFGGLWLGAGVDQPAPIEGNCADFGKVGVFPNCEDPKAEIGDVTVSGPGKITRNSTATWRVTIPSSGNVAVRGVRASASMRDIRLSTNVGTISAGSDGTATFRARLGKVGKFTATFKVDSDNGGSKTVTRQVNVVR